MRTGLVIAWVISAITSLSACEMSESERVASACTAICACMAVPLPALQDECVLECTSEVSGQIPDECLSCVSSHDSCTTLERDCEPLCNPPEPVFANASAHQ